MPGRVVGVRITMTKYGHAVAPDKSQDDPREIHGDFF